MSCVRRREKGIVRNLNGATSTGTARARIEGLSANLQIGIFLVFLADNGSRPSAFTGNAFDLFGMVRTESGTLVRLSSTAINGGQNAPDGWEGTTSLDAMELEFDYTGISAAGAAGTWYVVAKAEPAPGVSDAVFAAMAEQLTISLEEFKTAT